MAVFTADGGFGVELIEREHSGWRSLCDGTGGDFYGDIMTAGGVMILAHGFALTRADVVASLADAPPWERYEIDNARVIPIAEDVASVVYTGRGFRSGEPPFVALMSSTYVREDGRWRLAIYQQTPVPATASE
ncbi:nuclear transport factor 2 family protein [Microbacterium sp.]|uniref:nuclear transport factor 2 family protein n=1 Tax=Microbacterium sp. TaxID=51671 RepID=UPI00263484C5|nr:nuclear transport factor 2 family protein [Microbacterium sp.]